MIMFGIMSCGDDQSEGTSNDKGKGTKSGDDLSAGSGQLVYFKNATVDMNLGLSWKSEKRKSFIIYW